MEGSPLRKVYVGLDVHSNFCVFVVQDEEGEVLGRGDVPTTPAGLQQLRDDHSLPPGTGVALETGTTAFHVARQLKALGLEPVVVDAHEVRLKAHRPTQKSDRRDAFELCEGLRRGIYRCIVHVPDETIGALRETLSRRRHFVRAAAAEIHAAKRLLRAVGLPRLAPRLNTEKEWNGLFSRLPEHTGIRRHLERHRALWKCGRQQVVEIEKDLKELQQPFEEKLKRLQAVPGVGPVVAMTVVAVFSDVERFPSAKHAASYIGLVPSTHQSGDRDAHGRITKRGSSELRTLLCEAAQHANRVTNPLNPYFNTLCARRGYKSAVVAIAHRLCRILFAMLRHETEFNIEKLGVEIGPFETKKVRLYRRKQTPAA